MFGKVFGEEKYKDVKEELKKVQDETNENRPEFDYTRSMVVKQPVQQEQAQEVKYENIKKDTVRPEIVEESNQSKIMEQQFNQTVGPKTENKRTQVSAGTIPPFLSREMQLFKIMSVVTILITTTLIIYLSVEHIKPHLDNDNIIMLVPLALVTGFSAYKLVTSIIGLKEIKRDQQQVIAESRTGITTVPVFLLKVYRKLKVRITNMNWIAFTTYIVFGGLLLLYQQIVNHNVVVKFPFTEWKLIDSEHLATNPDWVKTKNFIAFALIAVVVLHVVTLINTRLRTGAIDSFYGYEIISNQEVELLKRHANIRNRRILIISLLCIFLLIWLPYKIIKGKRSK